MYNNDPYFADRIVVNNDLIYQNIEILPDRDMPYAFLDENYFSFKNSDGLFSVIEWNVTVIHYDRVPIKTKNMIPVKRISIAGDITFSPVSIIPKSDWKYHNIPDFFDGVEQVVMTCKEGIKISPEYSIALIQYE